MTRVETRPIAVSINEAARLLDISRPTMRRLLQAGVITSRQLVRGGRVMVSVHSLDQFMEGKNSR